jgi:hypothetical protein
MPTLRRSWARPELISARPVERCAAQCHQNPHAAGKLGSVRVDFGSALSCCLVNNLLPSLPARHEQRRHRMTALLVLFIFLSR